MDDPVRSEEAFIAIRRLAVDAAPTFSNAEIIRNAIEGEEHHVRKAGFELRDALVYRFDAFMYHLERIEHLDGVRGQATRGSSA